jgi:Family of unknown function (DUF5681)
LNRTRNPRSLQNLKPAWQPGESGNPSGRPKRALTEAYQAQLDQTKKGDGRTYAELIAAAQIKKALGGNTMAAKEVADRAEGKARQAMDVDVNVEAMPQIDLRVVFVDGEGDRPLKKAKRKSKSL